LKVLVTGGGGFLGKAIIRRLVSRDNDVRSFCRGYYPKLEELGVEQVQGDIGNAAAVEIACKGIDLVFHVAAKPPPWGHFADYYRTNVTGTQNVIDACINQKVVTLVYTSTPSVVFNGSDIEGVDESFPYPIKYLAHYPKTKALAEQKVVKAANGNLKTIILRPHEIWGPGDNHIAPRLIARAKRLKRIGNGKNLVDTTYIDNAADAHILASDQLEKNPELSGNIYFISQGEPVLAWDMIDATLNAAGLDPVKGSVPYPIAWLAGALFMAYAVAKAHWFDIGAARRDLGYIPRVSMEEGLRRLEEWLRTEYLPRL
jgi:nucleoside-diphosphate-sugar epimerase